MLPTREVFEVLGFDTFTGQYAEVQPSFSLCIGGHRITFEQITNAHLNPVFFVSGTVSTKRSIGIIELDMPIKVADFEQGVAWIAYALRGLFDDDDKPQWLRDGEAWADKLPWQIKVARYAALRAARPHCTVARDWFRLAANELRGRAADAGPLDVAAFMFDGEALTIRAVGKLLSMPGEGTAWREPINVALSMFKRLPRRLMSDPVEVELWQGCLGINRHRFPCTTASGKRLPFATIAWTPAGSRRGLGTVLLPEQPYEWLTPQAYRFALQSRLELLIEAAGEDAPLLLKKVEENEPALSPRGTPAQIAELLVEHSDWLRDRSGMPHAPVLAPLQEDGEALQHVQSDDDTLELYLDALYYDGGGY